MSIVNRRNAVIGWLVVKVGKRAAKQKVANADPRKGGAVAGALAALAGVLFFWRKKRGGGPAE